MKLMIYKNQNLMIFALIKYEAHYNQRINKKIFFKRKNNNDAIKFTIKALFRKYLMNIIIL